MSFIAGGECRMHEKSSVTAVELQSFVPSYLVPYMALKTFIYSVKTE